MLLILLKTRQSGGIKLIYTVRMNLAFYLFFLVQTLCHLSISKSACNEKLLAGKHGGFHWNSKEHKSSVST